MKVRLSWDRKGVYVMSILSKMFRSGGKSEDERRRDVRVDVKKGSYFRKSEGAARVNECMVRDISRGGIGLTDVEEELAMGDRLFVIYEIDGSPQKEEIEVVRTSGKDYGCVFIADNPARHRFPTKSV